MDEWIEKILRDVGYVGDDGKLEKFGDIVSRLEESGVEGKVPIPRAVLQAALDHDEQLMVYIHKEIESVEQSVLSQMHIMNVPEPTQALVHRLMMLVSVLETRNTTPHLILKKALEG